MGGIKQCNNIPVLNEFAPTHSNMLNLVMTASEGPTEILIQLIKWLELLMIIFDVVLGCTWALSVVCNFCDPFSRVLDQLLNFCTQTNNLKCHATKRYKKQVAKNQTKISPAPVTSAICCFSFPHIPGRFRPTSTGPPSNQLGPGHVMLLGAENQLVM